MKKIFTMMAAVLFAAGSFAASYGIMVNGTDYHAGELNPTPGDPSFTEYMVLGLHVANGATLQLWDQENNAGWAVDLDGASTSNIVKDGDHYVCNADGNYDFYIKLKYGEDQLYIGEVEDGGNQGGGQGGNDSGSNAEAYWYWKGYVDGVDLNNELEGGIFYCGESHIEVSEAGYIFVVYQKKGVAGVQYMTDGWLGTDITHATMTNCGTCNNGNRLYIPAGNHTLYLYDNGDGTVEVSRETLSGKKLMACDDDSQDIEQSIVSNKARKVMIDGQLRIVRGGKTFDATGRQL